MTDFLCYFILALAALQLVLIFVRCKPVDSEAIARELAKKQDESAAALRDLITQETRASRVEISEQTQHTLSAFSANLVQSQQQTAALQDKRLSELIQSYSDKQELLRSSMDEKLTQMKASLSESLASVQASVKQTMELLTAAQQTQFGLQDKRLEEMSRTLAEKQDALRSDISLRLKQVDERFQTFTTQNTESLEAVRSTMQSRLETMREDNEKQLEKMRMTVDEKLQKTLDDRISQSFKMVSERLQEVYTGLGEMKTLANGVGDLKKVLSNVKTRGILGELQLRGIIEELLPKEQYEENVVTKPGTDNRVEFAIKLPGDDEQCVYLPIDAKFPGDTYNQLLEAYDTGDPAKVNAAYAALETRIKGCAKDIHDKYIDPPHTTDFAIMFLPFEGLYAEVVRRGLIDDLQRMYKVNIAGPTTFAALLNSLQMGFRTLAIQKRSGEVWKILGAVKTEFNTFSGVLESAQKRIEQTGAELDKLIGVRTRRINSKLREVTQLTDADTRKLLDSAPEDEN